MLLLVTIYGYILYIFVYKSALKSKELSITGSNGLCTDRSGQVRGVVGESEMGNAVRTVLKSPLDFFL